MCAYCRGIGFFSEGAVAAVEVGIDGHLAESERPVRWRHREVITAHKIINLKIMHSLSYLFTHLSRILIELVGKLG